MSGKRNPGEEQPPIEREPTTAGTPVMPIRTVAFDSGRAQPHPECSVQGHSFEVIAKVMGGDPTHVTCTRCGETWHVERKRPA